MLVWDFYIQSIRVWQLVELRSHKNWKTSHQAANKADQQKRNMLCVHRSRRRRNWNLPFIVRIGHFVSFRVTHVQCSLLFQTTSSFHKHCTTKTEWLNVLNSKAHLIWPKSAQKGAQIFFLKKCHIFGKKRTIFDPPNNYYCIFMHKFFGDVKFSKFFSIFYGFFLYFPY